MISMKNDKIIASWNKIEPSDSANERMLSAILERNRSVRNGTDKVNNMLKTKKWLIPVVASLALLVAFSIPILHNMRSRIPLSGASSGVTVRYANLSGDAYQTSSVLIPLTEDELFTFFDTAIFGGTVVELNNIVVDCNGMKSYWCIAKIEVSKAYRGDINPGDTVSVRMDFPIINTQSAEDMDTLSQLRVGMRGLFMPVIYDNTSMYEHNGATLALKDIADFGFADGVRFAFLETSNGLVFDRQSYETISNATTLDEIEEYVLSKADHQESSDAEDAGKGIITASQTATAPTELSSEVFSSIQYGNTTGNISNNAFVAQDGKNTYYLRKTNPDTELYTSELVKSGIDTDTESVILSGYKLSYLNTVDEWVYYIGGEEGCIYRVRDDGSEQSVVSGDLNNINAIVVVNDIIYCRAADNDRIKTLFSISMETGEVKALCQLGRLCSGLIVNDGWIYYSVSENGEWKAYRIRTDGTGNNTIGDFQLYSACIEVDRIYYLDDNFQICSMGLDGADKKLLADGVSAIRINVSDGWIYYSDSSAIYKIRVDGSNETKLCDFPSSNNIDINVLGEWIYLRGDGIDNQRINVRE